MLSRVAFMFEEQSGKLVYNGTSLTLVVAILVAGERFDWSLWHIVQWLSGLQVVAYAGHFLWLRGFVRRHSFA